METKDLTVGRPLKTIVGFAIPLFIGSFFSQLYNIVDTMVAGYNLGDTAVGAIGAPQSLIWMVNTLIFGLNAGFALVIGRAFGAKDEEKMKRSIAISVVLNLLICVIMTIPVLISLKFLLRYVMALSDTFLEMSYTYYFIILSMTLPRMVYNTCAGIMRALGNSKTPLYFLIFSGFVNFGLDCLFIIVFKWNVAGAAIATVTSETLSAILAFFYMLKKYKNYLPSKEHFQKDMPLIKEMVALGSSMAAASLVLEVGSLLYQRSINALGDIYVVAHTAARKIITLCMMPLHALGTAASAFVSQNYGAGKMDRIKKGLTDTCIAAVIWGAFACGLVYLFGADMIKLLINTTDAEVLKYSVMSIRIHLPFYGILGCHIIFKGSLQALSDKVTPVISSAIEMALKVLAGVYFIAKFGFIIVCVVEPASWTLSAITLVVSFLCNKRLRALKPKAA